MADIEELEVELKKLEEIRSSVIEGTASHNVAQLGSAIERLVDLIIDHVQIEISIAKGNT